MPLFAFDHVNIRTVNLERMVAWYEDVLGLRSGPRPEFPVPGAWLYLAETCVIHLIEADPPPTLYTEGESLRMEHIAFRAEDMDAFVSNSKSVASPTRSSRSKLWTSSSCSSAIRTETGYMSTSRPTRKREGPFCPALSTSGLQ